MKLLPHQVKYANGAKDKDLLVHEGGTGKTICACVWLHDKRDSDALVICPKRIVKKWHTALKEWQTKATVVSKEQFKKLPQKEWSAIVVDECDEFSSPLFAKGRSQLSKSLYELIKTYNVPTLLLTATPIRSSPWNLHTLLCFIHVYYDYKKWREEFFDLLRLPYLPRPAWIPKKDWRIKIRKYLEKHADIVLLKDCVEYLPPVIEEVRETKCSPFKNEKEWTAIAAFVALHRHEQEFKVEEINIIAKEYRKVIVVAYFVEQIESIGSRLSKSRETFVVHGGTKNQEEILKKANEVDECFLVIQSSLGAGFDADTFSCVIFASMSYRVRDFVQMKFRVRRIHNLHPVSYYYLLGGKCDKAVFDQVQKGRDFIPSEYMI